jgi:2-haloacid dehalogenase
VLKRLIKSPTQCLRNLLTVSSHPRHARVSAQVLVKAYGVKTTLNRRTFVSLLAGGAAAALSAEPATAASVGQKIKAIAFDGLTVFDLRPIASLADQIFPGRGAELGTLWRTRQFEYTWLRTLGQKYVDFWEVTAEALVFSCRSLKLQLTKPDSDRLMQSYLELKAWPDAPAVLKELKASGMRMAFLSNFTGAMLDQAVKNSGLAGIFEDHLSTDRVRAFKPDPRAYGMAISAFGLKKEEIAFAAFGGWDAVGAKWFGYPTFWVNRTNVAAEELGVVPDGAGKDLNDLATFVHARNR